MSECLGNKSSPDSRAAEKEHVRKLQSTEWLAVKPFLAGTSYDVDHAAFEIMLFSSIVSCLPQSPGSMILDLGAGSCWVSEWLQKLNFKTCSLDIAEDMLRFGKKRLAPDSLLVVGDMAALPLADTSMDAAVCCGALHHVPDWKKGLFEIHRVLKPGGVLVLAEPEGEHNRRGESKDQVDQFGVLEQDIKTSAMVCACRGAGFTRAIVRPMAELGLGRERILPFYPFWKEAPRIFLHKAWARLKAEAWERIVNWFNPYHLIVAVKGNAWPDSQRPETILARLLQIDFPSTWPANQSASFRVRYLNTGRTKWLAQTDTARRGAVRLGISLLDSSGKTVNLDYARVDLPNDVEPGSTVEIAGSLRPPEQKEGQLRFDLVSEGICWFSARGSIPRILPYRLTS